MSFDLTAYRISLEGLRLLVIELSEVHDHLRDLCSESPSSIHRSELSSFSTDLDALHKKAETSLSAMANQLKEDKKSIKALVKCYRKDHYFYPSSKKSSPLAAAHTPKSGPIYCPGCGQLADTFCECGFSESYRGVA